MIYVLSRGLAQGRAAGIVSAAGLSIGLAAHTLMAAIGLSALLLASAAAFTAVKLVGAAYLVWIGLQMLRAHPDALVRASASRAGLRQIFWQGSLSALLNPKLALFFLAFLPQFIPTASARPWLDALLLGVAFSAIGMSVQLAVGWFSGAVSNWVNHRPRVIAWVQRGCGAMMILLGLRLALAQRD
jgi:threonine/homoserine/homoserine lactone efflux protein